MIAGSHVIVTGGGSGVGAATARAFADAGARVTILGRTESSLKAQHLNYHVCDVTDTDAVNVACEAARSRHGPINTVIANAGVASSQPFSRMTADDLRALTDVNLVGVFSVWQAALPDMKAQGVGRLVAIASTAGLKGYPYVSGYCAAKHAVVGLVRSLALELAQSSITVNAICPGFVETPMLKRSVENIVDKTGMSSREARASLLKTNPQKRFIDAAEVADTALWLCSEGARSVNGHALALSGGEI